MLYQVFVYRERARYFIPATAGIYFFCKSQPKLTCTVVALAVFVDVLYELCRTRF